MANLITRARALYNLDNRSTTAAEDTTLDALIAAVSAAIERYCRRTFVSTVFDELYDGRPHRDLLLDQFPIIAVERVAHDPAPVLRVQNSSAANQRATVQVTSSGLTLVHVASGVVTTNNVTFASNGTLNAMATAINALGSGWSASVVHAEDGDRAAADLHALQGAHDAKERSAELLLHRRELSDFNVAAAQGRLHRVFGWSGGSLYWRVIYTAGFSTVPEDVQEACAQWVAHLFWQSKRDPGLTHESIPGAFARTPQQEMPATVRVLLRPYRTARL